MLRLAHHALVALYVALPLATLAWSVYRTARTRHPRSMVAFLIVCFFGLVGGAAILTVNTALLGGIAPTSEFALAVYFATAALCLLLWADRLLMRVIMAALRVRLDARGAPPRAARRRAAAGLLVQRTLLVAVAVPYVATMLVVYRPHLAYDAQGRVAERFHPETVSLAATDGVRLEAVWVPALDAADPSPGDDPDAPDHWGRDTVLLCHGLASTKETQGKWAEAFVKAGYNVLALDLRAHGRSAGRLTTFGDRERFDVLGAVAWLKANRGSAARRVFGVGINAGAAALVAAQAHGAPGDDAQPLDALVLYEPYADLPSVARDAAGRAFPAAVSWLIRTVGVPLASLHTGTDLAAFSPRDLVARAAPSPVLVIHGRGYSFVPVGQEMLVYRAALHPKDEYWPRDNYARQRNRRPVSLFSELFDLMREQIGVGDPMTRDVGSVRHAIHFLQTAERRSVL